MHKSRLLAAAVALGAMLLASGAQAITYDVNLVIGTGGATGTIDTNGNLGVLAIADITGWNLALNDGKNSLTLASGNSRKFLGGSALTATAAGLFFDFGASGSTYFGFQAVPSNGDQYLCFNGSAATCDSTASTTAMKITGGRLTTTHTGVGQIAAADVAAVPEPATWAMMIAGLGLAGAAMRRRRHLMLA